jgi:hypothetical protein
VVVCVVVVNVVVDVVVYVIVHVVDYVVVFVVVDVVVVSTLIWRTPPAIDFLSVANSMKRDNICGYAFWGSFWVPDLVRPLPDVCFDP